MNVFGALLVWHVGFMGSLKFYKPQVPLRPIVLFVTCPTYQLSKYLTRILSPLICRTSSYIKNSRDFCGVYSLPEVRRWIDGLLWCSLLFQQCTHQPGLWKWPKPYLTEDKELEDHTLLPVDQIISLLKLCLSAIYLLFWGRCYRKIHATDNRITCFCCCCQLCYERRKSIGQLVPFQTAKLLFWKRYDWWHLHSHQSSFSWYKSSMSIWTQWLIPSSLHMKLKRMAVYPSWM